MRETSLQAISATNPVKSRFRDWLFSSAIPPIPQKPCQEDRWYQNNCRRPQHAPPNPTAWYSTIEDKYISTDQLAICLEHNRGADLNWLCREWVKYNKVRSPPFGQLVVTKLAFGVFNMDDEWSANRLDISPLQLPRRDRYATAFQNNFEVVKRRFSVEFGEVLIQIRHSDGLLQPGQQQVTARLPARNRLLNWLAKRD